MSEKKRGRNPARKQLIDETLAMRSSWGGIGVGVYGADVCALCGALDTFRGWIMAAYGCHYGRHGEFICGDCRRRIIPKGESGLSNQHRLVGAALAESRVRYCRLCRARIERHPQWASAKKRPLRLCTACLGSLEGEFSEEEDIVALLRQRVRRRYLELLNDRELTGMSGEVDEMREDLDSQR